MTAIDGAGRASAWDRGMAGWGRNPCLILRQLWPQDRACRSGAIPYVRKSGPSTARWKTTTSDDRLRPWTAIDDRLRLWIAIGGRVRR